MTIKKTASIKRPVKLGGSSATEAEGQSASPAGGATIADRFKLDVPDKTAPKGAGTATKIAVVVALIALAVAGILAFTLYDHWEFLKGA